MHSLHYSRSPPHYHKSDTVESIYLLAVPLTTLAACVSPFVCHRYVRSIQRGGEVKNEEHISRQVEADESREGLRK